MDKAIEDVLNSEEYTTTEERVKAIKQGLATLVIPKDKFNDLNTRLQNTETEKQNLQTEFDEFKKSKMTEDEQAEEKAKEIANKEKENNLVASRLAVKELLLDNDIKVKDDDTNLKETLDNLISEDKDKSIKLAQSFIDLLNRTKEETKNATTSDLLNGTPKPVGGVDSSKSVSKLEQLQKELEEATKNGDSFKQTSLMSQIFEEKNKQAQPK